jgi:hypothetical protein
MKKNPSNVSEKFHGIWKNIMKKNPSNVSEKFHGIPWKIPWNSMEKYNEKTRQMFLKNFKEFGKI